MKNILEELKEAKKTPSLTNTDLSAIVCDNTEESRLFSPFYSPFTNEKIINYFCRVGYVPFTRQCLNSEYIRHELNEDAKNNNTLEDLSQEYEEAKVKLLEEGFNV